MVVTSYIKLCRTSVDRHNSILMSLLLLVAETVTVFTTKFDSETSHIIFSVFWNFFLQSVTNRERLTYFKMIITKCDKRIVQSVEDMTK